MIFAQTNGPRKDYTAAIGTSYTDVISGHSTPITLESILVSNSSGSAVSVTVARTVGSTNTVMVSGKNVPANDYIIITDFHPTFASGEKLRMLAGTGSVIIATAVGIQATR